jgi:conjugal transfer pilus assembly protein TraW
MRSSSLACTFLFAFSCLAFGQDLGRFGPVYPVAERDLLELIQARIEEKRRTGELARIESEFKERARRSIESPAPVEGLVRTHTPRTFYYDPSYTLQEPVYDHEGKPLWPAGTTVNPLDYVSLSNHLIFFDARDRAQVEKALSLRRHYKMRVRLILTGGSHLEFMRRHDVRVYYDQHGRLVRQLGIRQVPAIVSQEGRRLRIDEIQT